MNIRVGSGYDIHQLKPGSKLILGGIEIPSKLASIGHSDGDVLIHAIIDAILGAAALGDIGSHFPSSDSKYAGIDSKLLLKETLKLISENNYTLGNIDCTVILQHPRLESYKSQIEQTLAAILEIEVSNVSVKAKTAEKMNATGKGEAIEAHAIVLISKGN